MSTPVRNLVNYDYIEKPFELYLESIETASTAFVDPYISLANDDNNQKISYDIKVVDKDVDVEDIFQWRTGRKEPMMMYITSGLIMYNYIS